MLTDTHCHLYKEFYDNIDDVVNNAVNNKVTKIISAADNIESSIEMIELSKLYNNIYICLGVHPEHCDEDVTKIEPLIQEHKPIAIGEIGLDYYYTKDNKDKQLEIFEYQLKLAEKYDLPVVIHSREATKDTIDTLNKYKVKGVIHCFSGSLETAKIYLKMGFYIGVGGVLTFINSKLKDVIKEIPLDRIVLETDSPFLAPAPHRGETNEPKYIYDIACFLAEIKEISLDEVISQTDVNVNNIFDI